MLEVDVKWADSTFLVALGLHLPGLEVKGGGGEFHPERKSSPSEDSDILMLLYKTKRNAFINHAEKFVQRLRCYVAKLQPWIP